MTYLIIGAILLLVLLPALSILPSARQRQQMKMRRQAMEAGIAVELTSIADPNPDQEKYVSSTGKAIAPELQLACYRLQRPRAGDWRRLPTVDWRLQKKAALDGEQTFGHLVAVELPTDTMSDELLAFLAAKLSSLPQDVQQVEEVSYNIAVYWQEREAGTEEAVIDFLKECSQLPLHKT
ncbi:MAG: hypothetical protein ACR2PJ_07285 [Pseudomonadales bacterium]